MKKLVIEFDNGDVLIGIFEGRDKNGSYQFNDGPEFATYGLGNAIDIVQNIKKLEYIRLRTKDNSGWWYPANSISKFKDMTEEDFKQYTRDGKLTEIGIN